MCVNFTAVGVNYAGQEYSREVGDTGPERPKAGRAKCVQDWRAINLRMELSPNALVAFFRTNGTDARGYHWDSCCGIWDILCTMPFLLDLIYVVDLLCSITNTTMI